MNSKFLRTVRSLWPIWLGVYTVSFLIVIGASMFLAPVGLYEAEKQQPHAFDNSYLSYGVLEKLLFIGPIMGLSPLIVLIIVIASYPKQQPKPGVEHE